MRVLFVSHSFPPPGQPLANIGGMQRVAVELERALARHPDVELTSRVLRTSWRWTALRTGPFLIDLLRAIPRLIGERGIDVVLFSSMVTAAVAPRLRERIRGAGTLCAAIPVGRDVTLPNPLYQRLVPRVLASLDLVFPISRATAEECLRRGARPASVHVVPCGVDLERLAAPDDPAAARRALLEMLRAKGRPVPAGALLLLSVGRHQERKGFHWFIQEVLPRLPEGTLYLLAGSGPMTPAIHRAVAAQGLENRVRLLGQVSDDQLRALYRGADLFVMPNISVPGDLEGFGVVMLEAGACGLPVLAAGIDGIGDVVAEGRNGHLLPSRDASSFATAIEAYRDPEALLRASRQATAYVGRTFAWDVITDRYLDLLRQARLPSGATA